MKRAYAGLLSVLIGWSMATTVVSAAPTAEQIAGAAANHQELDALITGLTPDEAASVVASVLKEIQASGVGDQSQAVALLYTRALLLSGENAPQLAAALSGQVPSTQLPVLAAATAVAVGSAEGPVFSALFGSSAGEAIGAAAADPLSVLGEDGLAAVQQLVIELRGVAAAVIAPPATAPMNLVPPIVPENEGTPAPPAAVPYGGQ